MAECDEVLVLVMETSLGKGSVSLLKNGLQIDCAEGSESVSKVDDLLVLIEKLLESNGYKRANIDKIYVSKGLGSLTGSRIGLATAKGLSDSLSIEVVPFSILEALAAFLKVRELQTFLICAKSKNSNTVFLQGFRADSGGELNKITERITVKSVDLISVIGGFGVEFDYLAVSKELFEIFKLELSDGAVLRNTVITIFDQKMPEIIGIK
jgi:tRNA threonylcarbamoyl adenosine modification protein YeaZ